MLDIDDKLSKKFAERKVSHFKNSYTESDIFVKEKVVPWEQHATKLVTYWIKVSG